MGRLLVALCAHLLMRVLRLLRVELLIRAILARLLALQGDLNSLALFVQIDVCDVAAIEREILLTHRVRIKCLVHSRGWLPLCHATAAACAALGRWFVTRGSS